MEQFTIESHRVSGREFVAKADPVATREAQRTPVVEIHDEEEGTPDEFRSLVITAGCLALVVFGGIIGLVVAIV